MQQASRLIYTKAIEVCRIRRNDVEIMHFRRMDGEWEQSYPHQVSTNHLLAMFSFHGADDIGIRPASYVLNEALLGVFRAAQKRGATEVSIVLGYAENENRSGSLQITALSGPF